MVPSHGGWTPFHPMYENSTLCTEQMSLEHLSHMGSRSFDAFFVASPNKLSKKQSGYGLFQTQWPPPCDVTVVCLTWPPDTGNLWPADVNTAGFPARGLLSQNPVTWLRLFNIDCWWPSSTSVVGRHGYRRDLMAGCLASIAYTSRFEKKTNANSTNIKRYIKRSTYRSTMDI